MKLFILWGQRKESYEGQYAPEALNCWTEFEVDENPEGFEEDCEAQKAKHLKEFVAFRVIPVEVSGDKIRNILVGTPEPLKGEVQE